MSEINEYSEYLTIANLTAEEKVKLYSKSVSKLELLNRIEYLESSLRTISNQQAQIVEILRQSKEEILVINKRLELNHKFYMNKIDVFESFLNQDVEEENTGISNSNTFKVGSIVTFGKYKGNDVEWIVLDKKEGSALIVSKRVINTKEYNAIFDGITWEKCTLRKWLNNEFINITFTQKEINRIKITKLENKDNINYGTAGGNNTQDKLFLLSLDEVNKYFSSADDRKANDWYWLRSPGFNADYAAYIDEVGSVREFGDSVNDTIGIRPACWIQM